MKYEEAYYVQADEKTKIEVSNYTQQQLEKMEQEGEFHCPGENCDAKLCLVHHSKKNKLEKQLILAEWFMVMMDLKAPKGE